MEHSVPQNVLVHYELKPERLMKGFVSSTLSTDFVLVASLPSELAKLNCPPPPPSPVAPEPSVSSEYLPCHERFEFVKKVSQLLERIAPQDLEFVREHLDYLAHHPRLEQAVRDLSTLRGGVSDTLLHQVSPQPSNPKQNPTHSNPVPQPTQPKKTPYTGPHPQKEQLSPRGWMDQWGIWHLLHHEEQDLLEDLPSLDPRQKALIDSVLATLSNLVRWLDLVMQSPDQRPEDLNLQLILLGLRDRIRKLYESQGVVAPSNLPRP